ncbi:hypothetical protein L798_04740 [Zootermopsis nevadensis]|uniref:Uncharacterized protein n=1 Tax=Zootermopsis nevadensis TaxID=136037 RepID=A0A067R8C1_ZOONE|nr:hypothetical protein L798_04740 [Zootermopsis nevadensis]
MYLLQIWDKSYWGLPQYAGSIINASDLLGMAGFPCIFYRSQWPRGLRHLPRAAWSLGPWVRIPLKAWMFVRVFLCCAILCTGRGLATGQSLIQGVLPTIYRSKPTKSWDPHLVILYPLGNGPSYIEFGDR